MDVIKNCDTLNTYFPILFLFFSNDECFRESLPHIAPHNEKLAKIYKFWKSLSLTLIQPDCFLNYNSIAQNLL